MAFSGNRSELKAMWGTKAKRWGRRFQPKIPPCFPLHVPGSLLGDTVVMVTLMPNIPDTVPNPGQSGEFLFLMDRSLFRDAQVPPEEVFRGWNFPHGSCPTGEDSGVCFM